MKKKSVKKNSHAPKKLGSWYDRLQPLKDQPYQWVKMKGKHTHKAAIVLLSKMKNGHIKKPSGQWSFALDDGHLVARFEKPVTQLQKPVSADLVKMPNPKEQPAQQIYEWLEKEIDRRVKVRLALELKGVVEKYEKMV